MDIEKLKQLLSASPEELETLIDKAARMAPPPDLQRALMQQQAPGAQLGQQLQPGQPQQQQPQQPQQPQLSSLLGG